MKMEPIVSSETSEIRTQTPGNYPKRNKLHLEHSESLKTRMSIIVISAHIFLPVENVNYVTYSTQNQAFLEAICHVYAVCHRTKLLQIENH